MTTAEKTPVDTEIKEEKDAQVDADVEDMHDHDHEETEESKAHVKYFPTLKS